MKTIRKKTWPKYYKDIASGDKTFELRKDEDDIQIGDILILEEWNPHTQQYTGYNITFGVSYVLRDCEKFGLTPGYCIIGLKKVEGEHEGR